MSLAQALRDHRPPGVSPWELESFLSRHGTLINGMERRLEGGLADRRIVSLNMGLGRDSFVMLCLLLERRLIAQGTLVLPRDVSVAVFSHTAWEWSHTYQTIPLARALCEQAGVRFIELHKPPREGEQGWEKWLEGATDRRASGAGRAVPPWRLQPPDTIAERAASGFYHARAPILEDYRSRQTVVSLNRQDCSSNHKILAIRRLLEDLARERFTVENNAAWGRDVRKGQRPPHLVMIGYAADEGRRLEHACEGPDYVTEAYPLMELGIRKVDEQAILERWHLGHVRKSGCVLCPMQPVGWYWALRETDTTSWTQIVEYEQAALSRNPRMTLLPGGLPIEQAVERWRHANPSATVSSVLSKEYACGRRTAEREPEAFAALHEPCTVPHELTAWVQARVLLGRRS